MSRGLRNNNPGNIRSSGVRYKGEKIVSSDSAFREFETMAWGYRAMFVLLHTYNKRHGLSTLRGLISRYAPPSENNTTRYIEVVASRAGISPDEHIDMEDKGPMIAIVAAMSRVENGLDAVMGEVGAGWELFIKHRP